MFIIFSTCRMEVRFSRDARTIIENGTPCLICYWHGRIALFPKFMSTMGSFGAVVSSHNDGEYLSRMIISYGHTPVRGSSRKNAVNAVFGLLKLLRRGTSVAITPDGPRGPRFKIKGAIGTIAARYDIPVIPMSYSTTRAIILNSWDRFIMPIPFLSRIIIDIGDPIITHDPNANTIIEDIMLKQVMKLDHECKLKMEY